MTTSVCVARHDDVFLRGHASLGGSDCQRIGRCWFWSIGGKICCYSWLVSQVGWERLLRASAKVSPILLQVENVLTGLDCLSLVYFEQISPCSILSHTSYSLTCATFASKPKISGTSCNNRSPLSWYEPRSAVVTTSWGQLNKDPILNPW